MYSNLVKYSSFDILDTENFTENFTEKLFPIVYYINLEHRSDRKKHILNQLKQMDYPEDRINRINAIKHDFGAVGCSRSHIKALELFLSTKDESCIIFEDDFTFYPNTYDRFHNIIKQIDIPKPWDIIMLSSNIKKDKPFSEGFTKAIDVQTASGYMVNRSFATTLLENYKAGEELLSKTLKSKYHEYGLDQYWKKLQQSAYCYIFKPKLGYQLENIYSDIEKKIVVKNNWDINPKTLYSEYSTK
jgi:glycosyl transferase family 25